MQILPSLPTDNIYKLKAVAGLWMLAGFIVLGFWSVYWQYQLEVQTRHTMSYYSSVNIEHDVLARMKSMQAGKFNENILKWVPPNFTISEEQNLLKIALENHRRTIALYKKEAEEERGNFLFYLGENFIITALSVYVLLMCYLLFFGFGRWYRKVQRPYEQSLAADFEIKKLTIEKIRLEIADLSKKERKPFKGLP